MEEKTTEVATKIAGEEYFVHSYGQEDWDEFLLSYISQYGQTYFAKYIYEFLNTVNIFDIADSFVLEFYIPHNGISSTFATFMDEIFPREEGFTIGFDPYIRITGLNENGSDRPLKMVVMYNYNGGTYHITLDNYKAEITQNTDFARAEMAHFGNVQTDFVDTDSIRLNGAELKGERDRVIDLFEGASYMRDDQIINLDLQGYTTGQIEKMIFRFSKYDTTIPEAINDLITTYVAYNDSSSTQFDGFYSAHCHVCATDLYGENELIVKSFDLNSDGTLHGKSASGLPTNNIVLRSVVAVIDQKHWGMPEKTVQKLEKYEAVDINNIDPNINEVFMCGKDKMYKIDEMSEMDVAELRRLYTN